MNPATLLRVLEDGLRPVVQAAGGVLDVASDPEHVVELLTAQSPTNWRMILGYAGERAVDADDAPGIRNLEISVTLQGARGLNVADGADAHRPKATGRLALLDLANQADLWMRGFTGTTYGDIERAFDFVSREWLAIEGRPTRQLIQIYSIRIGNDRPAAGDAIELTFPAPTP